MARIRGTSVGETLFGTTANDSVYGLEGNDTLLGGDGNDTLDGGYGNDTLNGGNGNDRFVGGNGNDVMYGLAGIDRIFGGNGQDLASGGTEADYIDGGRDDDNVTLSGVTGLNGGDGNDTIYGGFGDDIVNGDAGNDFLVGGAGIDTVNGGADTLALAGGVYGGGDWLSYSDSTTAVGVAVATSGAGTGGALSDIWSNVEHLFGSKFGDTLTASASRGGYVVGGAGGDIINAANQTSTTEFEIMRGDLGFDTLNGVASDADWFQAQYDMGMDRFENFQTAAVASIGADSDKIYVSKAMFALADTAGGPLGAAAFVANATGVATLSTQRLIFETDTRILWADKDGVGTKYEAVAIAVLDDVDNAVAALTASDFWVIA